MDENQKKIDFFILHFLLLFFFHRMNSKEIDKSLRELQKSEK